MMIHDVCMVYALSLSLSLVERERVCSSILYYHLNEGDF